MNFSHFYLHSKIRQNRGVILAWIVAFFSHSPGLCVIGMLWGNTTNWNTNPACNEFIKNHHSAATCRFLCTQINDCNVKKFGHIIMKTQLQRTNYLTSFCSLYQLTSWHTHTHTHTRRFVWTQIILLPLNNPWVAGDFLCLADACVTH